MGSGRAVTGKKRGGGGGSVLEAATLAEGKVGAEGVLNSLSNIKPEELEHIMVEIEAEVSEEKEWSLVQLFCFREGGEMRGKADCCEHVESC